MQKRILSLVIAFCVLLAGAAGRVGYIIFSGDYQASSGYNSYTLRLDSVYPTIYDRNMKMLNNKDTKYIAVIRPNEKCLGELENLFSFDEIKEINKELSKGYPVVKEIDDYIPCKHIQIFQAIKRTPNNADTMLKAVQYHFNDLIGERKINFTVDAKGRLLDGDGGTVVDENYSVTQGAVLTIDNEIQEIVQHAAVNMNKGAVVVLDANTNEILALYSNPNDNINRAFSQYSVGSVFKTVVSASAIENKIDLDYNCTGKITVGDTTFSCQNEKAHANETLKTALANSCNCYFVNLALVLGADEIINTAKKLGLDSSITLCENWTVASGNLPTEDELRSKGQLSLLGFGQGLLTTTPIQFAAVVSAFASGGYYIQPSIISGYIDENGEFRKAQGNKKTKVLSDDASKTVREYMRYVVTDGTGKAAEYNGNSAGKTSTAQTGRFVGNKEILNTWFAGFYPYDNPKYSIIVVTEDGISGSADCCPIFRTIVENLENK